MWSLQRCRGLAFTVIAFALLCKVTGDDDNSVKWIPSDGSQAILLRPDPAGWQDNHNLYLCRADRNSREYAGKLVFQNDQIYCVYSRKGKQAKTNTYKVLTAPIGALSWVPKLTGSVPKSRLVLSNRTTYPVCRSFHKSMLIPGTGTDDGCYIEFEGKEIYETQPGYVEILVINKYGEKIGAKQVL